MMRCLKILCVLAVPFAGPAAAQDLEFDNRPTGICVNNVHSEHSHATFDQCIGLAAEKCMETNPGGWSTVVMGGCLDMELQYWDKQLNVNYKKLMTVSKKLDKENGEYAPSQAKALREMQRAWIKFRDEKCGYEMSQWGGGTGGSPALASCLMRETAMQSDYLFTSAMEF